MSGLSEDDAKQLRETAAHGVMSPQQFEESIHTAWRVQQEECPFCREHVPWHRGVLFQHGHNVAWVCMLCALLEVGTKKKTGVAGIGTNSVERTVPLPRGYRLVWINTEWIPLEEDAPTPSAAQVGRWIGREATPRVLAAIIEDVQAARLGKPKDADDPDSPWRPLLISSDSKITKEAVLIDSFVGIVEERITTKFVHRQLGLKAAKLPPVNWKNAAGDLATLYLLTNEWIEQIPDMDGASRRAQIPRIGLAERETWEYMRTKNPSDIHRYTLTKPLDQTHLIYFIRFSSCGAFYFPGETPIWGTTPNSFASHVGYDFASHLKGPNSQDGSLWESVFGDALVPN